MMSTNFTDSSPSWRSSHFTVDEFDCDYAHMGYEDSYVFKINVFIVAIVNIVIVTPTIGFNAVIIATFVRKPSLRRQGNKLLLSLSIADLLSGILAQPPLMSAMMMLNTRKPKDIPCPVVIWTGWAGYTIACVSLLTVSFISLERYMAIFHPYSYDRMVTCKCIVFCIAAVWLFSSVVISTLFFITEPICMDIFQWTNVVIIGFSYLWNIYVYFCITKQVFKIHRETTRMQKRFKLESPRKHASDSKGTKVAGSIIMALLLCYLPQVVISLYRSVKPRSPIIQNYIEYWAMTFGLSNAMMNPIFYCYYNTEIRREVYKIFGYRPKCDHGERSRSWTGKSSIHSSNSGDGNGSHCGDMNGGFIGDLGMGDTAGRNLEPPVVIEAIQSNYLSIDSAK